MVYLPSFPQVLDDRDIFKRINHNSTRKKKSKYKKAVLVSQNIENFLSGRKKTGRIQLQRKKEM